MKLRQQLNEEIATMRVSVLLALASKRGYRTTRSRVVEWVARFDDAAAWTNIERPNTGLRGRIVRALFRNRLTQHIADWFTRKGER